MVLFFFLSNKPQQLEINSALSGISVSNTGAPQVCVSSPFFLLVDWCDVHKTEERSIHPSPVAIHGHDFSQVTSYRYLGFHIDSDG